MPRLAAYGTWESPIDVRKLFEKPSAPMYPTRYRSDWYWLEARARQGGRLVLMRRTAQGQEACLTPEEFNIRTRVHEYGGRCLAFGNGCVYFVNDADQCLYRQTLSGQAPPVPISPPPGNAVPTMFADLKLTPDGRYLICVSEQGRPGAEHCNRIVAVPLGKGEASVRPQVLVEGCDFYANPAVSPDGRRLAWIQWNHPNMPWDDTELMVAELHCGEDIAIGRPRLLAGGTGQCVCQVGYTATGALVYALDRDDPREPCEDYWNLYIHDADHSRRLTCDAAEFGAPHWVFGDSRHAALVDGTLLAVRTGAAGDELVHIDPETGSERIIETPYCGFAQLQATRNSCAVMVGHGLTEAGAMIEVDASRAHFKTLKQVELLLSQDDISTARVIRYATRDGGEAHAYFYMPRNAQYMAPVDSLPPLLVMVHGGPTSRASRVLDLARQYWTTLGFALLDVNHRGSTGYGRRYRKALLGRWGELDAADVVDAIAYVTEQGWADRARVFIRGRSAGGYVVLRVLTEYPQVFCGGACYFGIGNLVTLCESTHKFESRYTDRLVGVPFDPDAARRPDSVYYRRSPIHFIDRLRSPMIVFQGAEDRVVPPEVSREVAAALSRTGVRHEYVEYPGEGHGFRASETNVDALRRETRFYRELMKSV